MLKLFIKPVPDEEPAEMRRALARAHIASLLSLFCGFSSMRSIVL